MEGSQIEKYSDNSDEGILSRLFEKVFAQYWLLFWNHQSYEDCESYTQELEDVGKIWGEHVKSEENQQVKYELPQEDTSYHSRGIQIEAERKRKWHVLNEIHNGIKLLIVGSECLNLISHNDELDDIHTESLKYIYLPFMAAHVMMEMPNLNRMSVLRRCSIYLNEYMNSLASLKVLGNTEAAYWERKAECTLQERRTFKVTTASFCISLKKSLAPLFSSRASIESYFSKLGCSTTMDENTCRATLLDIARMFSVEAINMADMMKSELSVLKMRETDTPLDSSSITVDVPKDKTERKPWVVKIDDISKLDRETSHLLYKSMVFVPGHRLPSISLDECARIEMEMDVNTIGAKASDTKRGHGGITRVEETIDSIDSDDSDMDSDDAKEQAKWDDWKDDHPRGSGNKNRNVG